MVRLALDLGCIQTFISRGEKIPLIEMFLGESWKDLLHLTLFPCSLRLPQTRLILVWGKYGLPQFSHS